MQKAYDYIKKHHMIQPGDRIIVGVSGGADSLCLLFVLREYQKQALFSMTAVHVEHGIRGQESLEDAAFVEKLCRENGIDCRRVTVDVPELAKKEKQTMEEAARVARYKAFEEISRELGAAKIAVAHNREDQAETMLWNMARGTGITGAGGIRPVRGKIIRPLLDCGRREIEDYLIARGVVWRTDRTNLEREYTRNYIRHEILPAMTREINAGCIEHLARLGEELQRQEIFLRKTAEKAAKAMVTGEKGRICLDTEALNKEDGIIGEFILRLALEQSGCGLKDVTRNHIGKMMELCKGQSGRRISLPGGWIARREFNSLCIEKGDGAYTLPGEPWEETILLPGRINCPGGVLETRIFSYENEIIPQKAYTKWLNYDRIGNNLLLRTRRPGDYLVINREGGRKKLKDYFIEEKIPAGEREQILLVASGSEILWVIGYRISEAYKVVSHTEKVLEIQMKEEQRWQKESECLFPKKT